MTKICKTCELLKEIEEFKIKKSNGKEYREGSCRICVNEKERERQRIKRENPEYRKAEYASYKEKCIADPRIGMLERAKKRASRDNLPFNITLDDIHMVDVCPLLGITMAVNYGYDDNHNSYSLDRIDCAKGYTKGNIMVMSRKANAMKGDADVEELKLFCHNILKLISE